MSAEIIDFNLAASKVGGGGGGGYDPEAWDERLGRLRGALQARAQALVQEVFPLALVKGHEARIGNVWGDPGESLCIELAGEKAGQWIDHATNEYGDLISLWQRTTGLGFGFVDAVVDLEKWCGLSATPSFTSRVHVIVDKRRAEARDKAPRRDPKAEGPPTHRYVYTDPDGNILGEVLRWDFVNEKGEADKTFGQRDAYGRSKAPEPRPLYNQPQLAGSDYAVLVEGEKCADALAGRGIVATTAVGGCNAHLDKIDWEPLRAKTVVLWPDNDPGGLAFVEKVRPVLEAIGCTVRQVRLPADKPLKWDAADCIAEGSDPNELLATSQPDQRAPAGISRGLRILYYAELQTAPPPRWLVKGVLPERTLVMLYGPHGSAKSFVALDMALSVATGRPWQGRPVRQGFVLYVAGEGQAGIARRISGWLKVRGLSGEELQLGVVPQAVAMPTGQLDELLALLRALPEMPVLVVLDTVARTFGGGDENSSQDMNKYVQALDRLRDETGACVMPIHHSGKDGERGARGSTVLPGAVDVSVLVTRKGSAVTLKNRAPFGKMKDAEELPDISLLSTQVEVGQTEDGEPITTLVLSLDERPVEEGASDEDWADARRDRKTRLGNGQRAVLAALTRAKDEGQPGLGRPALAAKVGLPKGTLSGALKALTERGLIEEIGDDIKMWRAL